MAVVELGREEIGPEEANGHIQEILKEIVSGDCDATAVVAIKGHEIHISCTGSPELLAAAFSSIARSFSTETFQRPEKSGTGTFFAFEDGRNDALDEYLNRAKQ